MSIPIGALLAKATFILILLYVFFRHCLYYYIFKKYMRENNNVNISSKIIGSSLSGILEIGLFHPVDTVAKRLMYNKKSINGNLYKV